MLTLIAESKTMEPCCGAVDSAVLAARQPATTSEAAELMASWARLTAEQLAAAIGISLALARNMQKMIYEFPNKGAGEAAVKAYNGVVFKALDYATLPEAGRERVDRGVRIVSSLYGLLRPTDIIKPYRLDFTTKLAPGEVSMAAYWRPKVTGMLAAELERTGCTELLDLMPGDAARCIDMAAIPARATVWKVDFKEVTDGGATRTPAANRLKTLRGLLLRQIATEGIDSIDRLSHAESDHYMAQPADSAPGRLLFLC